LRKYTPVDEEGLSLLAKMAVGHDHSFCGGRSLIEEGSVRDVETGKRGSEGLEVDERFKTAL
jgi:hypothetical protein